MSSLSLQYGGTHYKNRGIQPVEFWADRKWDAFAGSILKYLTRWRDKGGVVDLEKALHFAQMRMELHGAMDFTGRPETTISMHRYVKANGIPNQEDANFYALERWVEQGSIGNEQTYEYLTFVRLLTDFIALVKEQADGNG